ncbi:MAG: hypothetical protein F6K41_41465 [Symploca sp. SIO3E6]|nr:hypothetical protein [Caldora sp. SIO3E6]
MKYKEVYDLSSKFSPPKIDLRMAEILDSYGDESHAKLPINHNRPEDVTREEFDYYGWIYPFMEVEDILFYFYPILIEYEKDKKFDCIDSFMYTTDRAISDIQKRLEPHEREALKLGLTRIWEIGGNDYADWHQCPNLQRFIGISV